MYSRLNVNVEDRQGQCKGTHGEGHWRPEELLAGVKGVVGDEDPNHIWHDEDDIVPTHEVEDLDDGPPSFPDLREDSQPSHKAYR